MQQIFLEQVDSLLLLGHLKNRSLFFGLFLIRESSLRYFVLRTGLVLVVETVSEGGGDFFPSDGLAASGVALSVVSDKGRRISFLEAGLFDGEVNVGDNRGFDHLGRGADVLRDLFLDEVSQVLVSQGLLGDTSFSNHDRTVSGNDIR